MVGVERVKVAVPIITLVLVLMGLGNVSSAEMSGQMLHVWDHSLDSSYYVYRQVNSSEYPLSIQWDAYAFNYTQGTQYVAIMALVDSNGRAWGFFWKNGTVAIFSGTSDPSGSTPVYTTSDGSSPHTYRIEVVYNPNNNKLKNLLYYIDGQLVYSQSKNTPQSISSIEAGGIFSGGKQFDLYLDNVVYTYAQGEKTEDFEDGQDDFFEWEPVGTDDGKSGAKVTDNTQVPEFPFLEPLFDYLASIIG
ncbi:hypothetical protein [Thermococcus gorgonarius]|uniref:Uncharacterized protein n=1 Tax=Thermococcus gorgonarius TaxID=71997 RepID=A0A2Z2M9P6_THEGO|nr:hypothetical protein [Thermococcus gorgonarius]ASJ01195.1 hypothetical protein A3K92_06720 [Thermococcus gorgonarius]